MNLQHVADTKVDACKMTDKEQAQRSQRLREELFAHVKEVKELEDGYALKVPREKEMFDLVHKHVWIEQECCPFFTFDITITRDQGPIWLKFKGGKRIKEMLRPDMEQLEKAIRS